MQFFNLFDDQHGIVIDFDFRVLLDQAADGGEGNTKFFNKLGLGFNMLM